MTAVNSPIVSQLSTEFRHEFGKTLQATTCTLYRMIEIYEPKSEPVVQQPRAVSQVAARLPDGTVPSEELPERPDPGI